MILSIGLTAVVLTTVSSGIDAEFIARVEKTPWLDSGGKPMSRIVRDAQGNVEKLRLSEMTISAEEFAVIGRLKKLRNLDLYRTNVTNADLRQFRELPRLEGLNLSGTEVSDAVIDEIMQFESLRSLCLGNVAVSPEAIARLKEHFRVHERRLSLGYYQRK